MEDAILYRKQLCILKNAYLKNTSITPFNVLRKYTYVLDASDEDEPQDKWCGTGKQMAAYDIDGKKYGCHMFTPLVLGKDKAILADGVDWESSESIADDYCKKCVLRKVCPTCSGFNYKYRGDIAIRDKRWCPMILAEAMTSSEFQVERISSLDKLEKEDAEHGQAALSAYGILKRLDIEKSKSPYVI